MNRPPQNPRDPRTTYEGIDVIVRDFASLQRKWTQIFNFECPANLQHFADDSAAAIDQLITNIGAENLRDSGIWQIVLGEEMHVSSGTFYYSIRHRLAENTEYLAARLQIPPPASYARGAERTMVLPGAARRGPEISPEELFGPVQPKDAPAPARRPAITEEDLFGTPAVNPEETRVVRQRGFPREWLGVDPNHNARATVIIGDWQGSFAVEAIGMTGCFMRTLQKKRYGDLNLQNACRIVLEIPGREPLEMEGDLREMNGGGKSQTLNIYFPNLTPEQKIILTEYNEYLHGPAPQKPTPAGLRKSTRVAVIAALGAAAAAGFLAINPVLELWQSDPGQKYDNFRMNDRCHIRYIPKNDSYVGSTDSSTLTQGNITEISLRFRKRSKEAAKAGMHQADLSFNRGRYRCETEEPLFVKPGETQEIPCFLTCVEQPPK